MNLHEDSKSDLEKMTIEFPNPLSLERMKALFSYVAKDINCQVDYTGDLSGQKNKNPDEDKEESVLRMVFVQDRDTFTRIALNTDFKFSNSDSNYEGMRFQSIPGYDLEEHGEDDVELLERVRNSIEEYFSRV